MDTFIKPKTDHKMQRKKKLEETRRNLVYSIIKTWTCFGMCPFWKVSTRPALDVHISDLSFFFFFFFFAHSAKDSKYELPQNFDFIYDNNKCKIVISKIISLCFCWKLKKPCNTTLRWHGCRMTLKQNSLGLLLTLFLRASYQIVWSV